MALLNGRVLRFNSRCWIYLDFFLFFKERKCTPGMLQLSVSTQQGLHRAGRLHTCSKKCRLYFNTCDGLGTVSEKEPVEQPGPSRAE